MSFSRSIPEDVKIRIVDMHAEATSEKQALGWYLDGRVTAVLGTHTHVPTADETVLPQGTAYLTDLGMTGPYESIIGMERQAVIQKFLDQLPARFEVAKGDVRLSAALLEADPETGRAILHSKNSAEVKPQRIPCVASLSGRGPRWRMKNRVFWSLVAASIYFFCAVSYPGLHGGQANSDSTAKQEARNQVGEFVEKQVRGAMPGRYQTMADMKRAFVTFDVVFAAYCRTPLLSPPRGFVVIHNTNADARSTPRGWPIPVGTGLILLAYDSTKRLPNGRFALEGEGPVLGGLNINSIECGNPPAERVLGKDEKSLFYYMPKPTGTVHGWPEYGGSVFMTRRTQPRWLPVTIERVLNVQIAAARKTLQDVDAASPQSAYAKWMSGRDERLRQYQQAHDELAKVNKQQADTVLANMLATDKQTEKTLAAMAQQGNSVNQMAIQGQANASKTLHDLETHLSSLSPEQRAAPAYVYLGTDGAFTIGQVVPPDTPGGVAVVYPNPDFYDHSLPPWEAQSICVDIKTGPRSKEHFLYPTIVNIWNSLDWDALAQQLK